jgi:hypothetical protein
MGRPSVKLRKCDHEVAVVFREWHGGVGPYESPAVAFVMRDEAIGLARRSLTQARERRRMALSVITLGRKEPPEIR